MKKRLNSILTNIILVSFLIFLLWVIYVGFIGGLNRRYELIDRDMITQVLQKTDYVKGQLESRFVYDDIYYIIRVEDELGLESLVWYREGDVFVNDVALPSDEVLNQIANHFEVALNQISLGIVDDELVFVIKSAKLQELVVREDLSVVYKWEGDV